MGFHITVLADTGQAPIPTVAVRMDMDTRHPLMRINMDLMQAHMVPVGTWAVTIATLMVEVPKPIRIILILIPLGSAKIMGRALPQMPTATIPIHTAAADTVSVLAETATARVRSHVSRAARERTTRTIPLRLVQATPKALSSLTMASHGPT
jgi:hypothetical protein